MSKAISRQRVNWVEESIIFDKPSGRQPRTRWRAAHLGSSITAKKILILSFTVGMIFFLVGLRVFFLHGIRGQRYQELADSNRQRAIPIRAERGLMFDRQGVQLVKNTPNFALALIPQQLPNDASERARIVQRLTELTAQPAELIRQTLDEYGSYSYESIIILDNLEYETALSIQIAAADLPGLEIQRGSKRLYLVPDTKSLHHLLGYEGKLDKEELTARRAAGYLRLDSIGKTGLEKKYETILKGSHGERRVEINALGKEQTIINEKAPVPGSNLRLSIDVSLQADLEQRLAQTLKTQKKSRAAAVALDPRNGEVLALVSLPSFDANDFSGGIEAEKYNNYLANSDKPLFNRAVAGAYPSGSVIKPALAAVALDAGIITRQTSFLSNGGIKIGPWFFPDWLPGGHGPTNVRQSLAWSVNTFYYYISGGYQSFSGLGVEKMVEQLRQFGFSEKLGIDLPTEAAGFLPSKEWKEKTKAERWYIGDTYNLSIGQGDLLATPLQIAAMTSVVANGGTLYRPRVVQSIIDSTGEREEKLPVEIIRSQIGSPEHLQTVRLGMKDCVDYGSCRRLRALPFAVAGKTGTAQWSNQHDPHAWFTSFAPFFNPEIVLTILIEEGGQGSQVAAAVAEDFYRWWGRRKCCGQVN